MIDNINIFDCTFREVGYQTGWFFDPSFCRDYCKFAQVNGIDYLELGFFHNSEANPNKGAFRCCSAKNEEVNEIFSCVKNNVKLSAMRDIQRPLDKLVKKSDSVIDTVRILTRSNETDFKVLAKHLDEVRDLGYEVIINFTSAGHNSTEKNISFAKFASKHKIPVIYFADTESIFTPEYIRDTVNICHDEGIMPGIHLHNRNGTAEQLLKVTLESGCQYTDTTMLGLGGKWHDGNISTEYLLNLFGHNPGYELTRLKTMLIQQLIKYNEFSSAVM